METTNMQDIEQPKEKSRLSTLLKTIGKVLLVSVRQYIK